MNSRVSLNDVVIIPFRFFYTNGGVSGGVSCTTVQTDGISTSTMQTAGVSATPVQSGSVSALKCTNEVIEFSLHKSTFSSLVYCFGTLRAHIQQDSEYIPWENTVTLTKRDALSSIKKNMATYTWLSRYHFTIWTYLGTILPCELVCIICTISP